MLRIAPLLAALLSAATLAAGELSMSPYRDCDAPTLAVVDRVMKSMGGRGRIDAVTNFHFTRRDVIDYSGVTDTVDLDALVVFPDSVRAHIRSSGGEMTLVVSPRADFMIDPEAIAGAAVKIDSDERDVLLRNVFADPLVVLKLRLEKSVLFGLQPSIRDGKRTLDVLRIDIRRQELRWFVDHDTGRIVRATVGSVDRDLGDWRTVGGLTLPFTAVEWSAQHTPIGRSTYQKAETNLPLDPDVLFREPTLWLTHMEFPAPSGERETKSFVIPSTDTSPSQRVVLPYYGSTVDVDYVPPVYVEPVR